MNRLPEKLGVAAETAAGMPATVGLDEVLDPCQPLCPLMPVWLLEGLAELVSVPEVTDEVPPDCEPVVAPVLGTAGLWPKLF